MAYRSLLTPIASQTALRRHVDRLLACSACPEMKKPVVSGGPVLSKVILVGQAPGDKEPVLQRPFAWTAGKTLFRWFEDSCGVTEPQFRSTVYMAAVCRCFPGKKATGGDRVPSPLEIGNCSQWLESEFQILQPELVIAVGRLAISRFLAFDKMEDVIGKQFSVATEGFCFDLIPLPHPSGASTWHRREPGRTLLQQGLNRIRVHRAFASLQGSD